MAPFLRRKKLQEENFALVCEQLSQTDGLTPLEAYLDNPDKEIPKFRLLIEQWIKEGQLGGLITIDGNSYVSKKGIIKVLEEELENGRVGIIRVAKRLRIPIKYVKKALIQQLTSMGIEGFWDRNERVYFTQSGARQAILELARGVNLRTVADVADELEWTVTNVIKTLESFAEDFQFRGFLDENGIIHETTTLKVDLFSGGERAEELLASFCEGKITQMGYVVLSEVIGVFGLNKEELASVLDDRLFRSRTGSNLRVSSTAEVIYDPFSHLELLFKVLFTHHRFPLSYLAERTGLPKAACKDILGVIRSTFPHISIDEDAVNIQSPANLLQDGINLKHLADELLIPESLVVRALVDVFRSNKNHFWVRNNQLNFSSGISFVCHLEGIKKRFPTEKVIVCLNCGNNVCFGCYTSIKETKICPRCGALLAFLLEFPRECPSCLVTFRDAEHLIDHRFCPICNDEIPMPVRAKEEKSMTIGVKFNAIIDATKNGLSIEALADLLKCSKEESMSLLETEILKDYPSSHSIEISTTSGQVDSPSYMICLVRIS
ncbi:MAG: hypothetical protein ACFFB3_00745 [Candidatus Hodarchaeota archaeon]